MGTREKQEEIRLLLGRMGWSLRKLADVVTDYESDLEDITLSESSDPTVRYEVIRGHFKRKTTPVEKLDHYLSAIMDHVEYESLKLDHVRPNFVAHDILGEEFSEELVRVSMRVNNP
ncbi:hypothetical protein [Grimontia sp. SpTr1]|uniref:hypothetical protein n=1 Tax=Grimontia sp. SpTr1 TaxID=2995319 RepID=UPI00248D2BFB|nr:hypothetical protein [Grimontia sp. SpTr1]